MQKRVAVDIPVTLAIRSGFRFFAIGSVMGCINKYSAHSPVRCKGAQMSVLTLPKIPLGRVVA